MTRKVGTSSFYDNPHRLQYDLGLIDFGTGSDITHTIAVPKNKVGGTGLRGRVVGVIISAVAENFAGSTLDAGVQVGDGTDADKYYDSGRVLDEDVDTSDNAVLWLPNDDSDGGAGEDAVDIEGGRDTVTVTLLSATGTPTGQANVGVVIDWY